MDNLFTLDFCKNSVYFQEKELPTGTFACEALNISEEVIAEFMEPMGDLLTILMQIGIGESVENCVDGIREIIFGMLEGLSETPPFHRLNIEKLTARADARLAVATAKRLYLHVDEVNYLDARSGNLSPENQKIRSREVSDDEVEIPDRGEDYEEQQWQQEEYSRVRAAFSKLSPKERFLIEKRNGIGGAAWTFEQLATAYEYSSTQSAERAYKKALRKLEHELTASEGR